VGRGFDLQQPLTVTEEGLPAQARQWLNLCAMELSCSVRELYPRGRFQAKLPTLSRQFGRLGLIGCLSCLHLLPRCYQDRTNQPHLPPCQEHPGLWFLVGLGCLRLGYLKFVNRRSLSRSLGTMAAEETSLYSRGARVGITFRLW
jgi:hypothetical protein